MNHLANIPTAILADLTTMERIQALKNLNSGSSGWGGWLVVLGVAAGAALAGVGAHVYWRLSERKRAESNLREQALRLGLRREEQDVLIAVAREGGLRRLDAIFSSASAFRQGAKALLGTPVLQEHSARIGRSGEQVLQLLAEKLGFQNTAGPAGPCGKVLDAIQPGSTLSAVRGREPSVLQATVRSKSDEQGVFVVSPEMPVSCREEEIWSVRLASDGVLWEFAATVAGRQGEKVCLRVASDARFINRRRFPRVPTSRPALVAHVALVNHGEILESFDFVEATVLEVGGPGLLIQASLKAPPRERLLVIMEMDRREVLQGMGTVVRSRRGRDGTWQIAMELIGLNPAEVAQLVAITNRVAAEGRRAKSDDDDRTIPPVYSPGAKRATA